MKACLLTTDMFCKREKANVLINQNVCLPKMEPLKLECRGIWGVWGVYKVSRRWYEEKEDTPTWDYTYQLKMCLPPIIIHIHMGVAHVGDGRW